MGTGSSKQVPEQIIDAPPSSIYNDERLSKLRTDSTYDYIVFDHPFFDQICADSKTAEEFVQQSSRSVQFDTMNCEVHHSFWILMTLLHTFPASMIKSRFLKHNDPPKLYIELISGRDDDPTLPLSFIRCKYTIQNQPVALMPLSMDFSIFQLMSEAPCENVLFPQKTLPEKPDMTASCSPPGWFFGSLSTLEQYVSLSVQKDIAFTAFRQGPVFMDENEHTTMILAFCIMYDIRQESKIVRGQPPTNASPFVYSYAQLLSLPIDIREESSSDATQLLEEMIVSQKIMKMHKTLLLNEDTTDETTTVELYQKYNDIYYNLHNMFHLCTLLNEEDLYAFLKHLSPVLDESITREMPVSALVQVTNKLDLFSRVFVQFVTQKRKRLVNVEHDEYDEALAKDSEEQESYQYDDDDIYNVTSDNFMIYLLPVVCLPNGEHMTLSAIAYHSRALSMAQAFWNKVVNPDLLRIIIPYLQRWMKTNYMTNK